MNSVQADQSVEVKGQRNIGQTVAKISHNWSVTFVSLDLCLTNESTHDRGFTCKLLEASGYLFFVACRGLSELNHLHRTGAELPHNS